MIAAAVLPWLAVERPPRPIDRETLEQMTLALGGEIKQRG
jgi:hypothetical protein